jgi:hypothetical protein
VAGDLESWSRYRAASQNLYVHYIYTIFRYIIKILYIEILKPTIIWNGGSTFEIFTEIYVNHPCSFPRKETKYIYIYIYIYIHTHDEAKMQQGVLYKIHSLCSCNQKTTPIATVRIDQLQPKENIDCNTIQLQLRPTQFQLDTNRLQLRPIRLQLDTTQLQLELSQLQLKRWVHSLYKIHSGAL